MKHRGIVVLMLALAGAEWWLAASQAPSPPWQAFVAAAGIDRTQSDAALEDIGGRWRNGYASMVVDVARFLPAPRGVAANDDFGVPELDTGFEDDPQGAARGRSEFPAVVPQPPGADIRRRLTGFLGKQTRATVTICGRGGAGSGRSLTTRIPTTHCSRPRSTPGSIRASAPSFPPASNHASASTKWIGAASR